LRHYEIVFLVHPERSDQVTAMLARYRALLSDAGGKLHRIEDWGRRQLAYPIQKVHKASYVLMNVECDTATLGELKHAFHFNDAVIRHMVVRRKEAVTAASPLARAKEKDKDRAERKAASAKNEEELAAAMEPGETPETPEFGEIEEIVVTGYRRSIQDAIGLKRDSDLILEAISAEDIGKLPDVSIAESLSRLPGLAGQRLNGRSQVISVRGLAPDFTTTLLNGRQQVSVGDNRSVEFDQYPSGLVDKVLVYKTPAASLLNHGLAGSVDLRTIRPLDLDDRVISINARYVQNSEDEHNTDGTNQGERLNLFYADQIFGGNLGVAFGFSYLSNPSQGEQHRAWGYPEVSPPADRSLVIGGIDSLVRTSELERTAFMAVAEWKPSDSLSVAADLYYSTFEEVNLLRGLELGLQWAGGGALQNQQGRDGFVVSGTFPNRNTLVRNDVETRETDLLAFGLNGEYRFSNWVAEADFSYSAADREDQIIESYSGTGYNNMGQRHDFTFTSDRRGTRFADPSEQFDYTDASMFVLTDPHGWGGNNVQAGYLNEPDIEDDLTQFRFIAKREFDSNFLLFFRNVEFGVNFSQRDKEKIANEHILRLGTETDAMGTVTQIQTKPLPENTWVTGLGFLGIPGITSYDPRPLLTDGTYELLPNVHPDINEKSWKVEEDVIQLYAQTGIEAQLFSMPLNGNFGVQLVFSDQKSDALGASPAGSIIDQLLPVSGGKDYTDFLPSLNLNLQLSDNQILRLGLARTLARARMDEMRSSRQFSFNAQYIASTETSGPMAFWGGSGGNPDLEPWRANSADLSYELYFPEERGYFAAAVYYKDLDSWVFTSEQPFDYSPFVPFLQMAGFDPAVSTGPYSAPRNGQGGYIQGYEISLTINGDLFLDILEPFGIVLNYAHNTSAVRAEPGTSEIELPGLSKDIANVTIFFEKWGFAARWAGRYRSSFIGELQGFGAGREFKTVANEFVTDAQLSYAFGEGSPLNGLSMFLQWTNLNDEPFATYQNNDWNQVIDHQEYGATWLFGFGYKF